MTRRFSSLLVLATLFLLWQVCSWAGWIDPLFLPPPSRLAAAAWRLARTGVLESHLAATLLRTVTAFLAGSSAGIVFGFALSWSGALRTALKPLLSASLAVPKITLLPLFMLLLGLGEPSRLMPAAATCFVVCAFHALDAVIGVSPRYAEVARNYGAGAWAQTLHVVLPACLPRLFTGLRVSLGLALVLNVSAEMLSAETGLGAMIWMAWQTLSVANLLVGVFAAGLTGLVLQTLLDQLERKLIPWSRY